MEHFQSMCLNDRVMTALYKGEMSWADASEDKEPLVLNGWEDYAKAKNAWNKPLSILGTKRHVSPPSSPPMKKTIKQVPKAPKKAPVISERDQKKDTLFIRDIPRDTTDEEIKREFEPCGRIQRYYRDVDRCFVILRFRSVEEAQYAYLTKLNQFVLKGKPRKISFAEAF